MIPGNYTSTTKQTTNTITFIGNGGKNVATGGQTITYHASSAAGDLLFLIVQCDDADNVPTPSGWTQLFYDVYSPFCRMEIFIKTKGSDTSVFVSDVGDHQVATVLTFRNVLGLYTFGAVDGELKGTNNETLPGVTTPSDNNFVLWVAAHDANSASAQASNWTNANITGGAELADFSTTTGWDGGFAAWGGIKATAGATGNTTLTWDTPVDGIIYYAIPLLPS